MKCPGFCSVVRRSRAWSLWCECRTFDRRWGGVVKSFVDPGHVPPVDPAHRGELDFADGLPDPFGVDQFRLVETVESLRQRIVVAIADSANRRFDTRSDKSV